MEGKEYMLVCGLSAAEVSVIVFVLHANSLTAALKKTHEAHNYGFNLKPPSPPLSITPPILLLRHVLPYVVCVSQVI